MSAGAAASRALTDQLQATLADFRRDLLLAGKDADKVIALLLAGHKAEAMRVAGIGQ